MNPQCERFLPLIVRLAEGALASENRLELDAHLASCAECRAALREQEAVRRILGEAALPSVSHDFASRVRARVAPPPSVFDLLNWRAWTIRLAPAAAVLALLAWYPGGATEQSTTSSQTLTGAVDDWAGMHAQVAGGALGIGPDASADPDALLAAALGETSR